MWHTLWNLMAVIGIGTTLLFVFLFVAFVISTLSDEHKKTRLNRYIDRKDDAE